jgi:diguanylate cyclase (GGDEF)-like protein
VFGKLARSLDRLPLGLTARFTLFVAMLILALTVIIVLITNREAESAAERSFRDRAEYLIALIGTTGDSADAADRYGDVQDVMNRIAAVDETTRYAFLSPVDAAGKLQFEDPDSLLSDQGSAAALTRALSSGNAAAQRSGSVMHVAVPVSAGGHLVGVARIGLSDQNLQHWLARGARRNIFLGLAFMAFALPLTAFLMSFVTAPIRRLTQATKSVADGQFKLSETVERHDELGELSRSFQTMVGSLTESFEAVQRLTLTDAATGLANREQMRRCITSALDHGETGALIVLEVARLKSLHQAFGPDVGDDVVLAISERLRDVEHDILSERDVAGEDWKTLVARLGSDEFGILVRGQPAEELARRISSKLLSVFSTPFEIAGHSLGIKGYAGIALIPADGEDFSSLLRSANGGLSDARETEEGAFSFSRRDNSVHAYRRLVVEEELRAALRTGQLEVFYQAQVDLADGAVSGAEALVRWRHPARGLVAPGEFIELAEEVGLLPAIGAYVLRETCRQGAAWARKGLHPRLSVNVSPSQAEQSDFAQSVLAVIDQEGMTRGMLDIEITESVAMRDPRKTARQLAPLRNAGIRIAIDDFGTGYSNLASLTRMPIDVLKIDRSFVSECVRDSSARVVVATILTMARNLGFETIAEGVESVAQQEYLVSQGCRVAQGYLFAKPMPAAEFEEMFAASRRDAPTRLDLDRGDRPAA